MLSMAHLLYRSTRTVSREKAAMMRMLPNASMATLLALANISEALPPKPVLRGRVR